MPTPGTLLLLRTALKRSVTVRLSLAAHLVTERAERIVVERLGMSLRETWILTAASRGDHSQLELADALGVNPNVMVLVVNDLERRRLVRRKRNPRNKREVLVVLTKTGTATLAELARVHAENQYKLFAPLKARDLKELTRLCDTLIEHAANARP